MSPASTSDTASTRSRGQSEVTGVLLLIGVLTISTTLVGGAALSNYLTAADVPVAMTDVSIEATDGNVTITHAGGNPIDGDAVEVTIAGDSGVNRYSLSDAIARTGDGDDRFEVGESAVFAHLFIGDITVRVADSDGTVLLADETVSPTLVGDPADYSVTVDNTNTPIKVNQTLHVRATIENRGELTGLQDVTLTVPGYGVVDTRSVRLGGGSAQQVELAWQTDGDDDGTYTVEVSSLNDSDTAAVRVRPPANFEVTIDSTNSPVNESEVLSVDATITNTGSAPDVQVIPLEIIGEGPVDYVTVGLDPGDSIGVTMNWSTVNGDAGTYDATITTLDDSATVPVSIGSTVTPPDFRVTIDSTNSPVEAGNPATVDATIENIGDTAGTQTITLNVTGQSNPVDSESVSLGPSGSQSLTLSWVTATNDWQDSPYTATVRSANASDSTTINVTKKAGTVARAGGPYSVDEGAQIELNGSGSTFQTGGQNEYNWTITSGPGTLQDNDTATPRYIAPDGVTTNTSVTVQLTVSDSQGTDTDTATITVVDTGPEITEFSASNPQENDVKVTFESDELLSAINVSIERDGSRVAVLTEDDFSTPNASAPYQYAGTASFSENATYNATLNAAVDSDGNDGASGQLATVNTGSGAVDTPPVPDIGPITDNSHCAQSGQSGNCNTNKPPESVEFGVSWSVSDSSSDLTDVSLVLLDPDGVTVVTENFSYAGNSLASGQTTLGYSPTKKTWNGTYTVRLTATDARGNTAVDTRNEVADGQ